MNYVILILVLLFIFKDNWSCDFIISRKTIYYNKIKRRQLKYNWYKLKYGDIFEIIRRVIISVNVKLI